MNGILQSVEQERVATLDDLIFAIGSADADTLLALRQFLLSAMFPSMPDSVRGVMLPLFALVTLETQAIERDLQRIGASQ